MLVVAANAAGVARDAEAEFSGALKRETVFGFLLRVLLDAALLDMLLLPVLWLTGLSSGKGMSISWTEESTNCS